MTALPPGKCAADKHYLGIFDRETLLAVLDLIERYPQDDTAYIGFFMTKKERQGYGLGSTFIGELMDELRRERFHKVRLAVDRGNPQSKAFWEKNGFALAVAPVGRCAARRCCGGHAASRMRARNPDGSEFTPSRSRVPAQTLRARSFRKARDD